MLHFLCLLFSEKLAQELEKSESAKKKLASENADYKDKLSSLALDLHKVSSCKITVFALVF